MRTWLGTNAVRAGIIGLLIASLGLAGCGALLTPHYRIERAQREMKAGKWQNAAFDLSAALRKQPKNTHAWLLLAKVSLDAADPNGANSALTHARDTGAKSEQVDPLQARVWLATGKAHDLLDAMAHRTITLPEPEYTVLRARALFSTGQTDLAVTLLQPLVARDPGLTEAQDVLAECLAAQGKLGEALTRLAAAERAAPTAPEPHLLRGRIYQWLGQFSAAEQSILHALKLMPASEPVTHRVTALIGLTESRLALGQIADAVKSQKALARMEPQAPETQLLDARIKLAHNDLVGATSELERVVNGAPQFVQARMTLGAALAQQGDYAQAQQQLQQVISETPDNIEARRLLADVQLKLGQPEAALGVLTPALAAPRLDPQLLQLFDEAAKRSGNSQALTEALERNVKAHPHDQAAADNLAGVYLSTGHADQALSLLQKSASHLDLRGDRLLITALLATRGPDVAGRQVEALVKARPRDPATLDMAASYWAARGQMDRARTLLRQAIAADPNDLTSLIHLAQVEEQQGDAAAAERRLSGALKAHPEALAVRLALAKALMQSHQVAQARTVLEGAKDADSSPDVQFGLAQVALVQGDLTQANAAFNRAIALRPGQTQLVEDAGLLLMRTNQYSAALDRFTQATTAEPGNAMYWLASARAQLALNQPAPARASLEKAAKLQPDWLPVVGALALIDVRQGQGAAALAEVNALLSRHPQDPGALTLKGDVQVALHQPADAVTSYSQAQRLRPQGDLAVKLYQARLDAHAADPSQSLTQWLQHSPNDWRVRGALADYYLLVAKAPRQAIPEYRQVLKQNPDDVIALNNLAWTLGESGSPEAESLAERAYKLAPRSAGVSDTLGWILAKQGEGAKALPYLAQAAKLSPNDPQVAYHYAYALSKTGQAGEAKTILSRILANPQPFDARHKAEQLLATLGA